MSGIVWAAYGARVAQTQGSDLYGINDNILLKGSEYTSKYNLNGTVVYDPKWYRCEAVLVDGPWTSISELNFGVNNASNNPMWDIIYYQYVVKRKLPAPWTAKAKKAQGFEGAVAGDGVTGWGDLIWSY